MARFDTVIAGGTVVDGTRAERRVADVGIRDGRIAAVGALDSADASRVVDARGLVVAPGFIDLHTHYDAQLFWDPYLSLSGWHGVTSAVIGNCGFGFAPVRPDFRERAMLTMTRTEAIPFEAMRQGMPWDWVTFPEYLDAVDRAPKAVNVRAFMPLAPLLTWTMGFERAKAGELPTDAEHEEMAQLLREAMAAGAGGFSAQRLKPSSGANVQRDFDGTPMVTDVMHDETMFTFARVLAERGDGFVQLTMAGDADDPGQSKRFFEKMAELSGRPMLYNVIVAFDAMPEIHRGTIAWLRSCQERGLHIYGQAVTTDAGFTFTFEDWNLFDEADAWREATLGTVAERLAKLADPARRPALRAARTFAAVDDIPSIVVLGPRTEETKQWANHTVGDVAKATGKHPVDAMLDIAVADGLRTVFYALPVGTNNEHLREILEFNWAIPGVSDGGAHTKFLTAGRYPTEFLIRAVRTHTLVSLEEAHHRLAALPAQCAGFTDRGTLAEGMAADVIVYDFDSLAMGPVEIAHDFPGGEWRRVQRASGYRHVLVNGVETITNDTETGQHSGRLLR
jgi:N-acyl-D-aspartate/D-glutamate deacylase